MSSVPSLISRVSEFIDTTRFDPVEFIRCPSLHLGCGTMVQENVINIDLVKRDPRVLEDDILTLRNFKLTFPELIHCISHISSFHVIEHLPRPGSRWQPCVDTALQTWKEMLEEGGTLLIECPDFDEVVKQYVSGNASRKDNIFGLNRGDGDKHLWGYGKKDLNNLLVAHGFEVTYHGPGTDYHAKLEPCQRILARKK